MNTFRLLEISEPKFPYKFASSKDAFEAVKDYGRADREVFLVLYLNAKNQLIDCEPVSVGTVSTAAVWASEVVKGALLRSAVSVILAHNHPSGDCTPSQADIDITKQIGLACTSVEIRVLDHIIIGRECYLSFQDSGKMEDVRYAVDEAMSFIGGKS